MLAGFLDRGGSSMMRNRLANWLCGLLLLLSGAALMVLRRKEPGAERPFKVPLYPWLPLLFCACSAYVLWASLVYVKTGALVGLGVLALGAVLLSASWRAASNR
jgi:amino acid transporter